MFFINSKLLYFTSCGKKIQGFERSFVCGSFIFPANLRISKNVNIMFFVVNSKHYQEADASRRPDLWRREEKNAKNEQTALLLCCINRFRGRVARGKKWSKMRPHIISGKSSVERKRLSSNNYNETKKSLPHNKQTVSSNSGRV